MAAELLQRLMALVFQVLAEVVTSPSSAILYKILRYFISIFEYFQDM